MNNYPVNPTKIAAYLVATVILEQGENNWCVYFDEIEERFPSLEGTGWRNDKDFLQEIADEALKYPQFEDNGEGVILNGDYFDCCAWTDYIACEYDADDAE